jgi:hypothetical protein
MGDFLSSAGSSLSNLFTGGGAAQPVLDPNAIDATAPAFDPGTGLPYPTSTYDPSGTLGAQAAVTGSPAAMVPGGPDVGGTQSGGGDTTGPQTSTPKSDRLPVAQPPSVTPAQVAALMAGQSTQGAPNPWQPGGGTPAPQGWPQTTLDQIMATRGGSPVQGTMPGTGFPQPQPPPAPPQQPGPQAPANGGPVAQGDDDSSQGGRAATPADATPPRPAAAPPAPQASQPGMGRGGMPFGGIGNLLTDIQGIMSGNPMALGKLVQDLMGMGGGPGGRQMPGWGDPMMQPDPARPYMQSGDPSTFGGPQSAGALPGDEPENRSGFVQRMTPPSPEERREIERQWQPQPGQTQAGVPLPQQRPAQAPARTAQTPQPPAGVQGRLQAQKNAQVATQAQIASVGPAAGAPLGANEASVPAWTPAAQRSKPSMRPTQPNVDRSRFQNEANAQTIAKAAWMVNGEVGLSASPRAQIVQLETAFNRAQARGTSLNHALMPSLRRGDAGYYDGRSQHPTYGVSRKPTPQQIEKFKREVWDPVMKGSNLSDIGWGPMTGNASGSVARDQFAKGTQGYKMAGGDTYFREGPFKYPFPTVRQPAPSVLAQSSM